MRGRIFSAGNLRSARIAIALAMSGAMASAVTARADISLPISFSPVGDAAAPRFAVTGSAVTAALTPDGLALSSRNVYLNADERRAATALYRSLEAARREITSGERNPALLLAALRRVIDAEPAVALDYAEIVDAETLEPVLSLRGECLILLAAKVGKTRLIDNALIEQHDGTFRVTL